MMRSKGMPSKELGANTGANTSPSPAPLPEGQDRRLGEHRRQDSRKALGGVKNFVVDYCQRHKHPLNAILHLAGVPMVFASFYYVLSGKASLALALFTGGYFLQYLGHKAQGNEVGEVTLIKSIVNRLMGPRES